MAVATTAGQGQKRRGAFVRYRETPSRSDAPPNAGEAYSRPPLNERAPINGRVVWWIALSHWFLGANASPQALKIARQAQAAAPP
jgi:hypothetical protein